MKFWKLKKVNETGSKSGSDTNGSASPYGNKVAETLQPSGPQKLAVQLEPAVSPAPVVSSSFAELARRKQQSLDSQDKAGLVDRFGRLRIALTSGIRIAGEISFDIPVRIDGSLSGKVFSNETLVVSPGASVEGELEVAHLIVLGEVRGQVRATKRVEIASGGRLHGEVNTPSFIVFRGAEFNGRAVTEEGLKPVT